jgi:hypothetical protein
MGKRKTHLEKLLAKHRKDPSPRSKDPRQLDLEQYALGKVSRAAFANLDEAIAQALEEDPTPNGGRV